MKKCSRCLVEKSLSDFHRDKNLSSGYRAACKSCVSKATAMHRKTHIETFREKERVRSRTRWSRPEVWKKHNRTEDPLKVAARNKLHYEMAAGRIVKPGLCESCRQKKRLHGHHADYSKPLDVQWLCSPCHAAVHREFIRETT